MRFGPTSLRLTTVLAKHLRRPALRRDLKVSRQIVAGETSYVIKIPETGNYARYGEYEYTLLTLCDGTRTPREVAAVMNKRFPENELEEAEVVEFLDSADPNTWERSVGERNLAILERIREERANRVNRASLLYIYFSAWNPDKLLERLHPYVRWMFTRGFVIFSICLFALNAIIVAADWERIRADTARFYDFTAKTAYDVWVFWVLLLFISGVHEFGHGMGCKHFGGEVHQMGFMLIYFTPSFYTDCTDMHMFDRSSKRLWTIFAGMWIELIVCGVATLAWYLLPPGSFAGDIAYKTLLLTGVSGIFINMNPVMKFDGYYALSQYLEIDNLREDAFEYLKAWLNRYLLRRPVDLPAVGRRKARIYLIYASLAFLYGIFILVLVTRIAKNFFVRNFGDWGYLMTVALVYLIMRKRLRKWLPGMLSELRQIKEAFMAWRMTRIQKAGAVAAVALVLLPPLPTQVATEFLIEPGQRAEIRAGSPGVVSEVLVWEGKTVGTGEAIAVLRNPELEAQAATARAETQLAERAMLAAHADNDLGEIQKQSYRVAHARTRQAKAEERAAGLVLRAPLAGVITTPQVEQLRGEYLNEGEALAVVADRSRVRARILVRDWELEDVKVGAPVELTVRPFPLRTFSGTVRQILPAAATDRPVSDLQKLERKGQELTNYLAVVLDFPNPEGLLREGMTGTAKISGARSPLAWKGIRGLRRWLASHLW